MRFSNKNLKKLARNMLQLSKDSEGNISSDLVSDVLQGLRSEPIPQNKKLLKYYLYYVKKEIESTKVVVEHSGSLKEEDTKFLSKVLEERQNKSVQIAFKENAELIAGLKITIGDTVWENSVRQHLESFQKKIS